MSNYSDFRNESILSKKWHFTPSEKNTPDGILITGPNSFIGVHVVDFLRKNTNLPVHLLIRAESEIHAIEKMKTSYKKWGLNNFNPDGIRFYPGNVCAANFGLSDTNYQTVSELTGTVIHLAMNPLYHLPYDFFRTNWLPELEKMIAFCGNDKNPKSLHYASSFNAAFFNSETDFAAVNTNAWQSGYAAFKWVASKAIFNAFSQNLQGCVYDIPLVVGSIEKGHCPDNYSIWHILNIFLTTGCFFPFSFRIIPVDILSESICMNILNEKTGKGKQFVRPVLAEPVNEKMFEKSAFLLGLQKSTPEGARNHYQKKHRFDFMIPSTFNKLLDILNQLPGCFPSNFETDKLPPTTDVFNASLFHFLKNYGNNHPISFK